MTTAHGYLALHLSRHEYKRGRHKGDAPADSTRRGKDHFRVVKRGDTYAVIFHNTCILTAYPDGSYMLDTSGWDASPTTREAMSDALGVCKIAAYLHTVRRGTYTQTALRHVTGHHHLCYYDGMKFGPDHKLLTPPEPFMRRQTDRSRTKEFRESVKPFREALPFLHATVPERSRLHPLTPDEQEAVARLGIRGGGFSTAHEMRKVLQTPELWPLVVARFKCETHAKTWAHIYRTASADLTELVPEPL